MSESLHVWRRRNRGEGEAAVGAKGKGKEKTERAPLADSPVAYLRIMFSKYVVAAREGAVWTAQFQEQGHAVLGVNHFFTDVGL